MAQLHSHEILPSSHFEFVNRWCHFHTNFSQGKMAEELKKYKDILSKEQKEFEQQLEREVSVFLSLPSRLKEIIFKLKHDWNFCNKFCQSYHLISFQNLWCNLSMLIFLNVFAGFRSKFEGFWGRSCAWLLVLLTFLHILDG